jgi:hypothetical protein
MLHSGYLSKICRLAVLAVICLRPRRSARILPSNNLVMSKRIASFHRLYWNPDGIP